MQTGENAEPGPKGIRQKSAPQPQIVSARFTACHRIACTLAWSLLLHSSRRRFPGAITNTSNSAVAAVAAGLAAAVLELESSTAVSSCMLAAGRRFLLSAIIRRCLHIAQRGRLRLEPLGHIQTSRTTVQGRSLHPPVELKHHPFSEYAESGARSCRLRRVSITGLACDVESLKSRKRLLECCWAAAGSIGRTLLRFHAFGLHWCHGGGLARARCRGSLRLLT